MTPLGTRPTCDCRRLLTLQTIMEPKHPLLARILPSKYDKPKTILVCTYCHNEYNIRVNKYGKIERWSLRKKKEHKRMHTETNRQLKA